MDTLNFPLFEEDWGADEELLLLEGIEMYGFGNWSDVSDHVGTKGAQDCKQHYFDTYINVPTAPLPDMTHILTTPESLQQRNSRMRNSDQELEEADHHTAPATKNSVMTKKTEGALPPKPNAAFSQPEFAGYMPNRGDFETDYENDAEMILCEMAFHDDDSPLERNLKLKVIDIYNQKLDERAFRKKFIQERNLFEYKKMKRGPDKDIHDRTRCFARLLSKEDHQQFVQGVIAERTLRRRIEELKKYRKLGIRTLDEAQQYQVYIKGREERTTRKSRESTSFYYGDRSRSETNLLNITAGTALAKERERLEKERLDSGKVNGHTDMNLDLSEQPGYDLLSERERTLCTEVALFPQQYILIKDSLLREFLKTGSLDKEVARQLVKIDASKTSKIFEFLQSSGWINKQINVMDVLPPLYHPQ
eukprot:TRINITY_DN8065_c0_g1_i1.p1 TRINITY_DN8065_c0_g1~~TRINITY_DN8065_c0_g1_i1.p1  ORF type:complete len:443 (-),score=90.43 TRINITY_DN8065_c0_g1_i1:87-1346(-)